MSILLWFRGNLEELSSKFHSSINKLWNLIPNITKPIKYITDSITTLLLSPTELYYLTSELHY